MSNGVAKRDLDFTDRDALEAWLNTQPREVSVIIAARAALRVLPFAARELLAKDEERFYALVSVLFRANALARVAAKYPTRVNKLAANDAAEVVGATYGTYGKSPTDAARAAAIAALSAAANAAARAAHAVRAAGDAFDAFAATSWMAVSSDANFLARGGAVAELADRPLWLDGTSFWANDLWAILKNALPQGQDWEVWTRWYEERLAGAPSRGETYELVFATVPTEVWDEGPAAANRWIKEHLPKEQGELPPLEDLPAQISAATQFSEGGAGPIDLLRDPASSDPSEAEDQREHYAEARRKALDLRALGGNILGDLQKPVAGLLDVLPDNMDALSIVKLWHRANSLRKRLADHAAATELMKRQGARAEPNPAILAYAAAGPLADFVESYNIFIVGDAKGRELDRKSLGPGERERGQAAIAAMEPIIAALPSAPDVATEAVPEILQVLSDAAKSAPNNLAGDQDVALARDSDGNFLLALIRKTYRPIADEMSVVTGKGTREKVYAAAIVAAGAAYWPAAANFIAERAEALKAFARLVYNNPAIPQMIDAITQHLLRGHI